MLIAWLTYIYFSCVNFLHSLVFTCHVSTSCTQLYLLVMCQLHWLVYTILCVNLSPTLYIIIIVAKKSKKRYYVEVPEPKYRLKEYESTLLLHSGGKSYLPSGKQTLFLHEVDRGHQTAPQYMVSCLVIETSWNCLLSCAVQKSQKVYGFCQKVK